MRLEAIILLISLSSCTRITYKTSTNIPSNVYDISRENVRFDIIGKREFFLWGIYPEKVEVVIDEEVFRTSALVGPSKIKIEEYQNVIDHLCTLFSLGLYVPKRYRLSGKGIRP